MTETNAPQIYADAAVTEQEKVIALFEFIKEMNKSKQKTILNISEYPWSFALSDISDDPENITVFYRDRVQDESSDISDVLLSVHKPEFQKCPQPDDIFAKWLVPGWDSYKNGNAHVKEVLEKEDNIQKNSYFGNSFEKKDEQLTLAYPADSKVTEKSIEGAEHFSDVADRVTAFEKWQEKHFAWTQKQQITEKTRNLFVDLYRLYFDLQRDSETMEIIVANGIICDREKPELKHPILTHRVKLNYDADENIVTIEDTGADSELYSIAFTEMDDVNLSAINKLNDDLHKNDYHPLDRNDTLGFFKVLIRQLSSDSIFSEAGIPSDWKESNRLILYVDPIFIVRKRLDGSLKAIESIIENIKETGEVPAPIRDIVSGGMIEIPEDIGQESVEEQLAAVGGESTDILLSKEANKEQLEIAKRIEYYNAVLVQGPPGTGKTHTIANLMGHFLAQGKSVLVTSHTTKALRVLKEKVAPGLQDLCVSILDDSNLDMERSIDGITSYMSKTTSHEMKREMDMLAVQRKDIIRKLAETRHKIFEILNQECNCIVYNGEDISPSKAAEFVLDHTEDLSYIPGKVRSNYPLPLTFEQLTSLYRSNEGLTREDEIELATEIPSVEHILSPEDFIHVLKNYQSYLNRLETIRKENNWHISNLTDARKIEFGCPFGMFSVSYPSHEAILALEEKTASFGKIEKWMEHAAVDGKKGGAFRQRWEMLIEQIQNTCKYAECVVKEQFGKEIQLNNIDDESSLKTTLEAMKTIFARKGKISKLTLSLHKDFAPILDAITINGKQVQSAEDCNLLIHTIELESMRNKCSVYWDELLTPHGVPSFFELNSDSQERIASNWIPNIIRYLDWYANDYQPLIDKLRECGFSEETIFSLSTLDSEIVSTEKILSAVETIIPIICDVCKTIEKINEQISVLNNQKTVLTIGKRGNSKCCKALLEAIESGNTTAYTEAYALLDTMCVKYELQSFRKEMLKVLETVAPQWADAIRNRKGIHGECTVPSSIEDAWKWKQLSYIIEEMTAKPFRELQADSFRLSKEYRQITAEYAEKSGWYNLLKTTEANIDMKQALQGWKQTVKRIGKGTGKSAPALKARARELMTKCQTAVPGWIMPINKALESLNPKANRFDIIIIDEASQSDVSSLAILYMGRKLIIVGDDRQVSPMAIGVQVERMNSLELTYIKDKIPNYHLYNAKTSIYDIAATTFQPLMLREHFRCVPEIIGFSNMLSYDYKIRPLRDASNSILLPAVVNYRVAGGHREEGSKVNHCEARAIVALMQACIEQPEYDGKSMGVISLLGDEQVSEIQKLIEIEIDPKELVSRDILCGNSANFQGDERDVIFLSVVDSGNGKGPIPLRNYGADDAYRKRYNVAASRARDQLWIVHSLDAASDLKPGDIRKMLIDYATNPHAEELKHAEVEEKAESPFETAVASALVSKGYHLVQQWKVGAYRLDMVAVCGKKTVAIECDGERWHSGEAKIREDMERQTILERLGWRFIRIRGSEYYRQPEETINRVIRELSAYEIEPEATTVIADESRNTELLQRVKNRAGIILCAEDGQRFEPENVTIAEALQAKESDDGKELSETDTIKDTSFTTQNKENTIRSKGHFEPREGKIYDRMTEDKHGATTHISEVEKKNNKPVAAPPVLHTATTEEPKTPVQMAVTNFKDMKIGESDIISLLKEHSVQYLDKRAKGGALWIVGGHELDTVVKKARTLGYKFVFKPEGGRATKGKAAWWSK